MTDSLALVIGLLLTIFIYSYLFGDNPLYRLAVHLLVGVSAGYAGVIATNRILRPVISQLLANPTSTENVLWLAPIVLSIILLFKWIRPLAWIGNASIGLLVTVGAAVALVGAVTGTILPQVTAVKSGQPLIGLVVALLSVCALLYFQFTGKADQEGKPAQALWRRSVSSVGKAVLMIAFGAIFAGVFSTSLVLLIDRVSYFMAELTFLLGIILQ